MKPRLIILAFCTLLFSQPARATPPDLIFLQDKVIGLSESQVFILRESANNLGLHIYGMHDVFLVAKSLKTGLDEEIWPVYRVHFASEAKPQSRSFPLEDAVNPYEIMSARAVKYISRGFLGPDSSRAADNAFYAEYLEVGGAILPTEQVRAQLLQSIALTLGATQPYPEEGYASMSFATPQELLENPLFDIQECIIDGVMTLSRYPLAAIELVQLGCDDGGDRLNFSLVVLIPASD